MVKRLLLGLLLLVGVGTASAEPLSLLVRGHLVKEPLFSLFAAPGEQIRLGMIDEEAKDVELSSSTGVAGSAATDYWLVKSPPTPGLYRFTLTHVSDKRSTSFNLFVGYTADSVHDGSLNGYLIGASPPSHSLYPALYAAPELFIEVTPETVDTQLTPHFTLRQFLCKQESEYPKYLVLRESLLVLLEGLLSTVQRAGYPAETFGVISGYRTPYYNHSIGNVPNSRHVYGDAMDLFVDVNDDGQMDDLNGDGERNKADVDLLYELVQDFKKQPGSRLLVGGIGRYYRTARHGGFVHVDARGFRARW